MANADLLAVRGGAVLDGTGAPPREETLLLRGGRIERLLPAAAEPPRGAAILDAAGCVVAPGFIDLHAHGDLEPLAVPEATSKICNGVTTEVCGNCGSTPFPLNARVPGYLREKAAAFDVRIDWHSAAEYFARLEAVPAAMHRLFLVGHGRLRGTVLGTQDRPATGEERERLAALLTEALTAGAWGLSSGLSYPPGCYADAAELTELCRVVAGHGGLYATHLRDESGGLLAAVEEALAIAAASGVRLHLSHLKISGEPNWPAVNRLGERLQAALAAGTDLSADWYPYEAWNANLDSLLPQWAYEGGTARLLSRLRDPAMRHRLADHILALSRQGISWEKVMVAGVTLPEHRRFQGRSLAAVAAELGLSPEDALYNLILAEGGRAEGFVDSMSEAVQAVILSWPFVAIGSDATARAFSGPSAAGFPHPRTYGTASRFLRRVREEDLLPLPEAVRRLTGLPAARLGLRQRGLLRPGFAADVTVFDPDAIADTATYKEPVSRPRGVRHVLVDGQPVLRDGRPTGARPGRLLRRGPAGRPVGGAAP
jgi:N-acyl-D-amino-acid deacylase